MNPLLDVIPARARKYVYAAVGLATLVLAAWMASAGDWKTAAASLLGAVTAALAHANTNGSVAGAPDDGPPAGSADA